MLEDHIPWAEHTALAFCRRHNMLKYSEDCVQVALLTLVQCSKHYQPNAPFRVYARIRIHGAIRDYVRKELAPGFTKLHGARPAVFPFSTPARQSPNVTIGQVLPSSGKQARQTAEDSDYARWLTRPLSDQESEVLYLMSKGYTAKEVACILSISATSVYNRQRNALTVARCRHMCARSAIDA